MKKTAKKTKIPVTDENFIVIPDNLGEAPYDCILVLEDEAQQKSAGGIIIPDLSVEKPDTGIIVSVGERTDNKPVRFEIGDRVIWGQEAGREIRIQGVTYLLIKHRDILWNFKH